jgi:hypothetical protein
MVRSAKGIVAHNLRRIGKGTLVGSVDLTVPGWHLTFCGCLWHRKNDSEWIAFPDREWRGPDGSVHYANLIKFTDLKTRDRFGAAALKAVRKFAAKPGTTSATSATSTTSTSSTASALPGSVDGRSGKIEPEVVP